MSTGGDPREALPPGLREAVRRDLTPVAPLLPPWCRACALALPALITVAILAWVLGREGSPVGLFTLATGGVSLLEWLAGFALVWLALREAVPGLGVGATRAGLAAASGIALQLALGLVLWRSTRAGPSGPGALAAGVQCASIEGILGLPLLAAATWLALRALPMRPRWSGALAGAAAGLFADAIWHLACARNDLEHLLVWHFGATVAMTLLGAVTGSFWPRRWGQPR